jgi:hypothetical protein
MLSLIQLFLCIAVANSSKSQELRALKFEQSVRRSHVVTVSIAKYIDHSFMAVPALIEESKSLGLFEAINSTAQSLLAADQLWGHQPRRRDLQTTGVVGYQVKPVYVFETINKLIKRHYELLKQLAPNQESLAESLYLYETLIPFNEETLGEMVSGTIPASVDIFHRRLTRLHAPTLFYVVMAKVDDAHGPNRLGTLLGNVITALQRVHEFLKRNSLEDARRLSTLVMNVRSTLREVSLLHIPMDPGTEVSYNHYSGQWAQIVTILIDSLRTTTSTTTREPTIPAFIIEEESTTLRKTSKASTTSTRRPTSTSTTTSTLASTSSTSTQTQEVFDEITDMGGWTLVETATRNKGRSSKNSRFATTKIPLTKPSLPETTAKTTTVEPLNGIPILSTSTESFENYESDQSEGQLVGAENDVVPEDLSDNKDIGPQDIWTSPAPVETAAQTTSVQDFEGGDEELLTMDEEFEPEFSDPMMQYLGIPMVKPPVDHIWIITNQMAGASEEIIKATDAALANAGGDPALIANIEYFKRKALLAQQAWADLQWAANGLLEFVNSIPPIVFNGGHY